MHTVYGNEIKFWWARFFNRRAPKWKAVWTDFYDDVSWLFGKEVKKFGSLTDIHGSTVQFQFRFLGNFAYKVFNNMWFQNHLSVLLLWKCHIKKNLLKPIEVTSDSDALSNLPIPYWPHLYMPYNSDFTNATQFRSNESLYRVSVCSAKYVPHSMWQNWIFSTNYQNYKL